MDAHTSGRLYVAMIRVFLLYGSETWLMTPYIGRFLAGFHHIVARRLTVRQHWRGGVQEVGVSPAGVSDGERCVIGGEYLRLLPPEHSHIVHCNQARYGHVSGIREFYGVIIGEAVVGSGRIGLGRYAYGGSGG